LKSFSGPGLGFEKGARWVRKNAEEDDSSEIYLFDGYRLRAGDVFNVWGTLPPDSRQTEPVIRLKVSVVFSCFLADFTAIPISFRIFHDEGRNSDHVVSVM
jgi:hypothetical protein